jgi:cyclophilin family peptidyl-prolyl cis-trans isomerase
MNKEAHMFKGLFFIFISFTALLAFASNGQAEDNPVQILMKTSKGDMTIELYPDKAPLTVKNFLHYVDKKFYDGTIFHRVMKGFMIQAGGWTPDFLEKDPLLPPVKNESLNELKNRKYTIAMARMIDPHSATAQFYINHVDNHGLDFPQTNNGGFGYCVFGTVIAGTDVVEAIANSRTTTKHGMQNVPRETITILSVTRK